MTSSQTAEPKFSLISRRGFLRSAGVTLALPFLPSLAWRAFGQSAGAAVPPRRFAFIYTPNGYNQKTFIPAQTGAEWELTPALSPLAK